MKTYNIGFIGFGFIGKVHAFCHHNLPWFYENLPFETRISRVVTSRSESAEAARRFLHADSASTDFRTVTEAEDIDIVHICSPNHLHLEPLLSAMGSGKHIYCDKPVTATVAEVEKVEKILPDYRGTTQVTFQNRFFPSAIRARQIAQSGVLGKIHQFRAVFLHSGSASPDTPLKWKLSAAAGGGVIADLGSHAMDFVEYLLGDICDLRAATSIAYAERPSAADPSQRVPVDAEDAMFAIARLKNGATGTIEATKLATGSEDELRIEVHGSDGALRFNSMTPHWLEYYNNALPDTPLGGVRGWTRIDCGQRYEAPATMLPGKVSIGWVRAHAASLYEFMRAVHEGRPGDPDLAHGIHIQHLMKAVRDSAKQWPPEA